MGRRVLGELAEVLVDLLNPLSFPIGAFERQSISQRSANRVCRYKHPLRASRMRATQRRQLIDERIRHESVYLLEVCESGQRMNGRQAIGKLNAAGLEPLFTTHWGDFLSVFV